MKELCWVICDMILPAKIQKGVAMVVKFYCLRMAFHACNELGCVFW